MDENNNLNGTDSGQPQNEYTGEYGNSVETDGSDDSVYSYSYKNGANNAESTHSGDYYAGNNNAESTMNDSRQQGYQSSNDTQNGFESSYRNENPYQKANPYETNMNNNYNNTLIRCSPILRTASSTPAWTLCLKLGSVAARSG